MTGKSVPSRAQAAELRRARSLALPQPQVIAARALVAPDRVEATCATPVFEQVYAAHFQHVSRWARALGGLDADVDDLTQEVFMVVRRKLQRYTGPSLSAWLYGITRKTVSDYRRRAWMRRLLGGITRSLTGSENEPLTAADPYDRLEAQRILRRVLGQLSDVRRTAFILFEIEGYSGEEIAELEQIPLATVYTRLYHARKDFLRFTAELTDNGPEEPPP